MRDRTARWGRRAGCGAERVRARRLARTVPRAKAPVMPVAAALTLASAVSVSAQDIEVGARLRGIRLPEAYWERVRRDPDVFTLPHGVVTAGETARGSATVSGEVRLPVILALFSDSPTPTVAPVDVERALFTGPAPEGTVTEYYSEVSGGRFTFRGDVLPWVRTSLTLTEVVGDSHGLGAAAATGAYLLEALALDDPHVDFGRYDDDGPDGIPNSGDDDGFADVVTFEFLEVAASCGGPAIWPHRSSIAAWTGGQPYVTDDLRPDGSAIRVNGYIIQGVTDCSGRAVQTAATIAHELGHALGLPDYYHPVDGITPENRRWVLGCWALMAGGSWGCGEVGSTRAPFGPTHMISWSKHGLGWLDYDEVGEVRDAEFELLPVEGSARGLRIPLDPQGLEALLLEYRERVSFDEDLPAAGVLVVHQDGEGALRPRSGFRYRLRLTEADGGDHLLRTSSEGGNRGDAGDVFGTGGPAGPLHNATTPSLRRNEGTPSTVTIHSIVVEDGRARVRLSTAAEPRPLVPAEGLELPLLSTVQARYRIAGGAAPYQASATGGPGLEVRAEDDELVLSGAPDTEGVFDMVVRVVDALGTAVETVVRLAVGTFQVSVERLVGPLLRSDARPLTGAEEDVLDRRGNGNGRYDVGDVRAWLTAAEG